MKAIISFDGETVHIKALDLTPEAFERMEQRIAEEAALREASESKLTKLMALLGVSESDLE